MNTRRLKKNNKINKESTSELLTQNISVKNMTKTVMPSGLEAKDNALPPISSKAMFWRPRYLDDSQCLQHVPFYFWLTEAIRPLTIVEPNLNSAVGYFSICQSVDKLNLDSFIYGAIGKSCDKEKVAAYNHEHYREFSCLYEVDELSLLDMLDDSSIDLLLLKHDSTLLLDEINWELGLRKLAKNAVVLIHGSRTSKGNALCQSLYKTFPSFELVQGQGVMLLCVGPNRHERLEALLNLSEDITSQRTIQNVYGRLGGAIDDAWQRQFNEQRVSELSAQLEDYTRDAQQISEVKTLAEMLSTVSGEIVPKSEFSALENELNNAYKSLEKMTEKADSVSEQLKQSEAELAKVITEVSHLKASNSQHLQTQRELNALLERDQQVAADKISQLAQSELSLQQSLNERFEELATLTNMLMEKDKQFEQVSTELSTVKDSLQVSSPVAGRLKGKLGAVKHRRLIANQLAQDVELIRQSGLFDEECYLQQYPQAKKHKHGAIGHYLTKGIELGANPSPSFNSDWYLDTYPDVKNSGGNPLLHYIKFGRNENRLINHFLNINKK